MTSTLETAAYAYWHAGRALMFPDAVPGIATYARETLRQIAGTASGRVRGMAARRLAMRGDW